MILAIDVHYRATFAKAVAIEFATWNAESPTEIYEKIIHEVEAYIPGQFYKRELPCIQSILRDIELTNFDCIIIDGYVTLDDHGKPGLGWHLYEALDHKIPVVGIAKTTFKDNKRLVYEVFRGQSNKPLYITSIGIDLDLAASFVAKMSGTYRMPDLLKLLDQHTKA